MVHGWATRLRLSDIGELAHGWIAVAAVDAAAAERWGVASKNATRRRTVRAKSSEACVDFGIPVFDLRWRGGGRTRDGSAMVVRRHRRGVESQHSEADAAA